MSKVGIASLALLVGRSTAAGSVFNRFCGIAATEQDSSALTAVAGAVGAQKVWYYNWLEDGWSTPSGMEFVPMIKTPSWSGATLPSASTGTLVAGWNEPDDAGQAGSDPDLMNHPSNYAQAWTIQMSQAKDKGYRDFVSPSMAQDTCWLDFFWKACEETTGCKGMVTYLGMHHYRSDCDIYNADPCYMGWRDDLSYVLTYYRLMQKYNARGFNIKGLIWDELGCVGANDAAAQARYMQKWLESTVIKVKQGDASVINMVKGTQAIMPKGPDADTAGDYKVGMCKAQDGGPQAPADAVRALQSVTTVAWFGIVGDKNLLFNGSGLSGLGKQYLRACSSVARAREQPAPVPSVMV